IVSEWLGIVYYVYADGRKEVLLDTHEQKRNTADIHYDQSTHILYIPGFNTKTVSAWRLKGGGTAAILRDPGQLDLWRQKWQAGDPTARQLINQLKTQADQLIGLPLLSVMDKDIVPPSGSKHDYMSQAPYFWYDSSKPNGLPYIRHDGRRNPGINKITDHHNLAELGGQVQTLALAWYFTGERRYADNAAQRLRHWFLDEATRMNRNLEYGQGIPGINTGRGIGIIETIPLIGIADAATLLEGDAAWTAGDAKGLRSWYAQYLDWMLTSKNGREEHQAANNHGTWYLAQATAIALYTGDLAKARTLAGEGKAKMDHQIEADGRMPEELARTNGLGYSTYNLQAFFTLARLATRAGVNLWQYTDSRQGSIRSAFDWLLPYALDQKKWDYQQIGGYNKEEIYTLLLQAYPVYADPKYLADAHLIHPNGGNPVAELSWGL
ncbi:alginate lyase family protein, partial [Puia sp.]|uniref:alginate lyase family protein n=1 Tax=Puia sp. TaxID=2045100 RepID=UPI002F3F9AD5